MSNFKFLQSDNSEFLLTNRSIFLTPHRYNPENVEFCFQFDNEEPVVFATGPNQCTITLSPSNVGNMTFNNNGHVFKLFARERQND